MLAELPFGMRPGPDDEDLHKIYRDLKRFDGEKQTFTVDYPCHSETEERWVLDAGERASQLDGGLYLPLQYYRPCKGGTIRKLSEEFNRSIVKTPDCVKSWSSTVGCFDELPGNVPNGDRRFSASGG